MIYARHLREDRATLAVRVHHMASAAVARLITANGGYEVAYVRDRAIA